VDANLSSLSDLAFEGAAAGYLLALVCHAVETATRRAPRPAAAALAAGQARESAAAGGTATAVLAPPLAPPVVEAGQQVPGGPRVPLGERFGRAAVTVTAIGFACHVLALVFRGLAAGRPPWGNMYEFTLMITGAAVAGWLVVLWRTKARLMGIYVMLPIVVLVFLAGTVLYTQSAPLLPVLNSYWLIIHVAAISLSSGVLMLSGVASAAYLVRDRHDRRVAAATADGADGTGDVPVTRLPSLDKLDRIAYRSAITAFPFYTFAIMAGAMWAEVAWGSYWSWDPKETVALVSWVVYAGYLHARATAGWRGRPAAWISVVGLATIIFNLFFVNMVISGLHSYAGLN
jgi:cytochrome c-type biogenesis protein CcsB